MYCQVCGFKHKEALIPGMICSCCGYEYDVDEYITLEEIYVSKKYRKAISPVLLAEIENLNLQSSQQLPLEYAYKILRSIWINEGCKWRYNSSKMIDWNFNEAKKQLKNIGVTIENNGCK